MRRGRRRGGQGIGPVAAGAGPLKASKSYGGPRGGARLAARRGGLAGASFCHGGTPGSPVVPLLAGVLSPRWVVGAASWLGDSAGVSRGRASRRDEPGSGGGWSRNPSIEGLVVHGRSPMWVDSSSGLTAKRSGDRAAGKLAAPFFCSGLANPAYRSLTGWAGEAAGLPCRRPR